MCAASRYRQILSIHFHKQAAGSKESRDLKGGRIHQSANDTFPTALHLAAIRLVRVLESEALALQEAFQAKEKAFAHVVNLGRGAQAPCKSLSASICGSPAAKIRRLAPSTSYTTRYSVKRRTFES